LTHGRVILGIDPGTATLGYGVIEANDGLSYVTSGALVTAAHQPAERRLLQLHDGLCDLIRRFAPSEVAVEQLFFSRNVTTAITVGQARGVALLAAAQAALPVSEFTPLQVKQAVTGHGRADKQRVQEMVAMILRLDFLPEPDDAADALALAICHANSVSYRARIGAPR
jgi:crossover junction endodeoxyribonuclease RuvC